MQHTQTICPLKKSRRYYLIDSWCCQVARCTETPELTLDLSLYMDICILSRTNDNQRQQYVYNKCHQKTKTSSSYKLHKEQQKYISNNN